MKIHAHLIFIRKIVFLEQKHSRFLESTILRTIDLYKRMFYQSKYSTNLTFGVTVSFLVVFLTIDPYWSLKSPFNSVFRFWKKAISGRQPNHWFDVLHICTKWHCECDGNSRHKFSQWRIIFDWVSPRESVCSCIHSKLAYDWLSNYVKAVQ